MRIAIIIVIMITEITIIAKMDLSAVMSTLLYLLFNLHPNPTW